nr:purine permease 1-like isoform X2 [Lolium perenne]
MLNNQPLKVLLLLIGFRRLQGWHTFQTVKAVGVQKCSPRQTPKENQGHPSSRTHRQYVMDVEEAPKDTGTPPAQHGRGKAMHRLLVALNCGMLILGTTGGPLLSRLYFSKGGHRQWLAAWLETGGWPLLLIPVVASYLTRRSRDPSAPLLLTRPRWILLAAAALGVATGADDFLYAYGLSYVPVSTSAILISTQLAFTVLFAFLIVRLRLTAFSMNAVALITIGAVVLGLHASSDRPAGVTKGQYWMGFFLSLGAAALYGLVLPLVELTYKRAASGGRVLTYALVVEMQLVMGFFATAFCTVGMIVNNDFQALATRPSCNHWN